MHLSICAWAFYFQLLAASICKIQLIFLCWPYYWGFIGLADNRGVSVVCSCFSLCPRNFPSLVLLCWPRRWCCSWSWSTQPFTMKCDEVLSLLSLAEFNWLLFWGCWWILACTFICLEIFVRFGRWVEKHFPSLVSEKVCVISFEQFTTESLWVCSFLCARFYLSIIDSVSVID